MAHYPYHAQIRHRINNGELTGFEYVDEYNKIKPCLLLYFKTFPYAKPIRSHRWAEYKAILNTNEEIKQNENTRM